MTFRNPSGSKLSKEILFSKSREIVNATMPYVNNSRPLNTQEKIVGWLLPSIGRWERGKQKSYLFLKFPTIFSFLAFLSCEVKNRFDPGKQLIEQLFCIKHWIDTENIYPICSPPGAILQYQSGFGQENTSHSPLNIELGLNPTLQLLEGQIWDSFYQLFKLCH